MSPSRRVMWAVCGALAAAAVIVTAVLVGARPMPVLGDRLDVAEPLPAISLTGPVPTPTQNQTPTASETRAQPTPAQTTVIAVPNAPETVPVPSGTDDDDDDDNSDDS